MRSLVTELEDGLVERGSWDGTTYAATRWVGDVQVGRLELVVRPQVRLHVEAGGWVLRGGVVGPDVLWQRGGVGAPAEEREAPADGFTGAGPAYALALLPLLGSGQRRLRLRLLEVTEPVLAVRLVDQEWLRTAETVTVTDLATGERRTLTLP